MIFGAHRQAADICADRAVGPERARRAGRSGDAVAVFGGADFELTAHDRRAAVEVDFTCQFASVVGDLFHVRRLGEDVRKDLARSEPQNLQVDRVAVVQGAREDVVAFCHGDCASTGHIQAKCGRIFVRGMRGGSLAEHFDSVATIDIEIVTARARVDRNVDPAPEARFERERNIRRAFTCEGGDVRPEGRREVREHLVGLELHRATLHVPDGAFVVSDNAVALGEGFRARGVHAPDFVVAGVVFRDPRGGEEVDGAVGADIDVIRVSADEFRLFDRSGVFAARPEDRDVFGSAEGAGPTVDYVDFAVVRPT